MKIKRILLIGLAIALPIFVAYVIANRNDLAVLRQALTTPGVYAAFFASACFLVAAHVLRAYKTKQLIDPIKDTSLRTHIRALFIGYLFNTLLPLRLGEVARAFVLGKGIKMSSTFMFGLIVLERAVDGIVLSALGFGLLYGTNLFDAPHLHSVITLSCWLLLAISMLAFGVIYLLRTQPTRLLSWLHKGTATLNDEYKTSIRFKIWSLMYGLERIFDWRRLARYAVLSVVMWAMYIAAVLPLTTIFIQPAPAQEYVGASYVSYLGIAAPAGPAHTGAYGSYVQPYIDSRQKQFTDINRLMVLAWLLQVVPAFAIGLVFVLRTTESLERPADAEGLMVVDDKLLRNVDVSQGLSSFLDAFFSNNSLSKIMHRLEVDKNSKLVQYFKGGSNAITALVYENNRFVVRKITPIQYAYKLKSQYDWLQDKMHLDRIVTTMSEEMTSTYYRIDLEFSQSYVPFLDYIHSMPIKKSKQILTAIFEYMFENVYRPDKLQTRYKDLDIYITNRCLGKIKQAAEVNEQIRSLSAFNELVINGQPYRNISHIIDDILHDKNLRKQLATYRKCSIHGDITIDNILVSKEDDSFLLIDPNDNENEISGPVFDFGRLGESLMFGYEFLCRDDRKSTVIGNQVEFEYAVSNNYVELEKHVASLRKKFLTPEEQLAVPFHAAMMYSRMLTHRVEINPANAAKFYAISVIGFNRFMDQANAQQKTT